MEIEHPTPPGKLPIMRVPSSGVLPTKREFEARVLTACKTIRALPDREAKFLGTMPLHNSVWREALDEWEAYAAEDERERFRPDRHQVDDCMVVLAWCAKLEKRDFRIVWARSFDLSFTRIADFMRLIGSTKHSRDTAARRYNCTIDKIYDLALRDMRGFS